MKEFFKKNFAIVLAFTLPLALILTVFLSIYLPSLFLSTNYNFIYATCADNPYSCEAFAKAYYSVSNGKLVVNNSALLQDYDGDEKPDNYTTRLFLHDTENNLSREITLKEAQTLSLDSLLTSPDGVTVTDRYTGGADFMFLFDSGSSYGHYLTKGNSRSKLNLINDGNRYYYHDDFYFVGWTLPGRN